MQSVDRIIAVLEAVAERPEGASLAEIGRAVGLPVATCHRLLNGLGEGSVVEQDLVTRRWRPGPRLLRLSTLAGGAVVGPRAESLLLALRDRWQECTYLAVRTGDDVVCVSSLETTDPLRMSVSVPIGRVFPPHASAAAKAIIAQLDARTARRLVRRAGLPALTGRTITDLSDLARELAEIRAGGFARCDEEMELGVAAYAAAVPLGTVGRAVGVIGPRDRLRAAVQDGLAEDLKATAAALAGQVAPPSSRTPG